MGLTISTHLLIWLIMKKNMRSRRFWTLGYSAGTDDYNIWSNGRATLTPDLDNMWVNKDDVFAKDKVREFKTSNPDARTHIRYIGEDRMPQFPLCYVTVGMFAQCGLSSTAKTLRSLKGGSSCRVLSSKRT